MKNKDNLQQNDEKVLKVQVGLLVPYHLSIQNQFQQLIKHLKQNDFIDQAIYRSFKNQNAEEIFQKIIQVDKQELFGKFVILHENSSIDQKLLNGIDQCHFNLIYIKNPINDVNNQQDTFEYDEQIMDQNINKIITGIVDFFEQFSIKLDFKMQKNDLQNKQLPIKYERDQNDIIIENDDFKLIMFEKDGTLQENQDQEVIKKAESNNFLFYKSKLSDNKRIVDKRCAAYKIFKKYQKLISQDQNNNQSIENLNNFVKNIKESQLNNQKNNNSDSSQATIELNDREEYFSDIISQSNQESNTQNQFSYEQYNQQENYKELQQKSFKNQNQEIQHSLFNEQQNNQYNNQNSKIYKSNLKKQSSDQEENQNDEVYDGLTYPLKKNGEPDLRYRSNKQLLSNVNLKDKSDNNCRTGKYGGYDNVILSKDGKPDMRYKINKQRFGNVN